MRQELRIPEVAQRDRFVRHVAAEGAAFGVTDAHGLVSETSPRWPERMTALLWSTPVQAARWAPIIAADGAASKLLLGDLLARVMPQLATEGKLVGTDWSDDPLEPEMEPADLADRLRHEVLRAFVPATRLSGVIYLLEDASGAARTQSRERPGLNLLPCWSREADALHNIAGPWASMHLRLWPVESFLGTVLPWLEANDWQLGPDYAEGAGMLEISPADFAKRLSRPS